MTAPILQGVDLLRRLAGSAIGAVGGAVAGQSAGARPIESASFADLLSKAAKGELDSGRLVAVGDDVDLTLNESQIARLSAAADDAEAAGATRLLALVDGKALTIDLTTRTIDGAYDASTAAMVTNVDAAAVIPPEAEAPAHATPASLPITNKSLNALLEGARRAGGLSQAS